MGTSKGGIALPGGGQAVQIAMQQINIPLVAGDGTPETLQVMTPQPFGNTTTEIIACVQADNLVKLLGRLLFEVNQLRVALDARMRPPIARPDDAPAPAPAPTP